MKLHEDKDSFEAAIIQAAEHFKIPQIFIEKDYWVTYALYELFHSPEKDKIVFKGGTALSKCYKIISRFSEDIDLVMIKAGTESGDKLKKMMKGISKVIDNSILQLLPEDPLTNKNGNMRKTVYSYPKAGVTGKFGQVRENIVLEVSHLGSFVPNSILPISTLIAEYVLNIGRPGLITQFGLENFDVVVLSIERTFCEKVISLVRFSYDENPLAALSSKVRHIYDLHQLLLLPQIREFVVSQTFDAMLLQVGTDDDKAIPNDKDWIYQHPADAIIFKDYASVWNTVRKAYTGTFKELVTGKLPDEESILATLKLLSDRIAKVSWTIKK
jgi:hypothetical protein